MGKECQVNNEGEKIGRNYHNLEDGKDVDIRDL